MPSYLQLQKSGGDPYGALMGQAIVFDETPIVLEGPAIAYDNLTGTISLLVAGAYYVSWFVAPQSGLTTNGSNFGLLVDGTLHSGGSGHVRFSPTAGFAMVEAPATSLPVAVQLANIADGDIELTQSGLLMAGLVCYLVAEFSQENDSSVLSFLEAEVDGTPLEGDKLDDGEPIIFALVNRTQGIVGPDTDGIFILPNAGAYLILWEVAVDKSSGDSAVILSLIVNGSAYGSSYLPASTGIGSGNAVVTASAPGTTIQLINDSGPASELTLIGTSNLTIVQIL